MPRVSVAMPAYNCERYIGRSIESLLGQTYGDFELVISDNASSDGTADLCRAYAKNDKRVRYVRRETNIGGPGNFRYVFSLCTGEYHKWSTADDFWAPTFVAKAVQQLDAQRDAVLCYPKTQPIDPNGEPLSGFHDDTLHLDSASPVTRYPDLYRRIGLCNAHLGLIRRDAMSRTRLIAGHRASDIDFLGELALMGKFVLIPERLFFRRFHPASSSWRRDSDVHQQQYYAPQNKIRSGDRHAWQRMGFRVGSVARADIRLSEKAVLFGDLLRECRWSARALAAEMWHAG